MKNVWQRIVGGVDQIRTEVANYRGFDIGEAIQDGCEAFGKACGLVSDDSQNQPSQVPTLD